MTTSVAIVGHGASLEGAGRGAAIDAATVVMRMHDCAWHAPADHGERFDVGVLPGPWLARACAAIGRTPVVGWFVYRIDARLKGRLPPGARLVDLQRWQADLWRAGARCREGRPALTRGTCAALMAMAVIRPGLVAMHGCDALAAGGGAYAYPASHPKYRGAVTDGGRRHDIAAERALLERAALEAECELAWT